MKKYLSIREFARSVGRTQPTISSHIKRGNVKLETFDIKIKKIPVSEVAKFLKKYGDKAAV